MIFSPSSNKLILIRDDIATAAIEFDYDLIIEARPKLIQLQSVYGSNFGKEELVNAIKAQNEIVMGWHHMKTPLSSYLFLNLASYKSR